jgi:hypothetical protein
MSGVPSGHRRHDSAASRACGNAAASDPRPCRADRWYPGGGIARGYEISEANMFTKTILFAVLAACGAQSHETTNTEVPLGGDPVENAKALAAARDWLDQQMQMQMQASNRANAPDQPDKLQPEEDIQEDQHFCCHSVDPKSKTGDGCVTIGANQIDTCGEVLYCPGFWAKHDGKVSCE